MGRFRGFGVVVVVVLCGLAGGGAAGAADDLKDLRDTKNIRDIRDIRGPLPLSGVPPFALTAGVVTGAAAAAGFLALRRKTRQAPDHPIPQKGSEAPVEALRRLAASYRKGELPADLLCLHLAPLLRSTLSERTGLPGSRLTTPELLQRAKGEALLPAHDLDLAAELLNLCDRVKFAAHKPNDPETEAFLAAAARLVAGSREEPHEVS